MPRTYTRKTTRADVNEDLLINAAQMVADGDTSIRSAAATSGVNRMTLARYITNKKKGYDKIKELHQVFTDADESSLAEHIKMLDNCFHGLDSEKCRKLALDFATSNQVKVPANWTKNGMAGMDWLASFMKRNKLSNRKPEATSLARQTAFNKTAVAGFFLKLSNAMSRYEFAPGDIYNLDETGVTTVQAPTKVVSATGKKQVGSTTSQERGELTTLCCAINASGNHIPPFYIFPRVFMKEAFMNGCAPGAKGVAAKTGYMNSDLFADEYLPFFITSVRCSKQRPVLLILDNHCSHVSIKAVELCRESGIHLLTLPPHTSHKLQPLDRCVYGPLKTYFNKALDDWMRSNPGRNVSIYEMASLSGKAFSRSMTPDNILSSFRCTGIFPLNSQIFGDDEFISASVTDQPAPPALLGLPPVLEAPSTPIASTSALLTAATTTTAADVTTPILNPQPSTSRVTPDQILPLPKAGPRKPSNRRKLKSAIITDTPEKERLEAEIQERATKNKKRPKVTGKIKKAAKKRLVAPVESSTEEEELAKDLIASDSDSPDEETWELGDEHSSENIEPGIYVLVKFVTDKMSNKFYAGEVVSKTADAFQVKFMRRVKDTAASFSFPEKDDISHITFQDVILILGLPISIIGTKRVAGKVMFRVDLSGFAVE